ARAHPAATVHQTVGDRTRPRLDQQPDSRSAQRDRAQLLVRHLVKRLVRDLAAGRDADRDPLTLELGVDRLDAALELVHLNIVIGADVRRRAYDLDPVRLRLPRHRDAVLEVDGAVVERGQDVRVQIDHGLLLANNWAASPPYLTR